MIRHLLLIEKVSYRGGQKELDTRSSPDWLAGESFGIA